MEILRKRFATALGDDCTFMLIRGIVGILLGIVLFVAPGLLLLMFVYMFNFTLICDGSLRIYKGINARKKVDNWWGF
ncbi:MAG: hypothetical protein GXZ15_05160 [Campylobacter sp.]|nr:hypothetical protein [Campylobacter sp.]